MSQFEQIFDHERLLGLSALGLLVGDEITTLTDSVTVSSWAGLAASVEVGEVSLGDTNISQFLIEVDGRMFLVPIYDWSILVPQPAGSNISTGNGTALTAYEVGAPPNVNILVGKSDGNIPLMQAGAGLNPSGSVQIRLHSVTTSGGLLDRLLATTGQRQLICMQCDQNARPAPPPHGSDLRHNGKQPAAAALSTGEVWWPAGQRSRSLTVRTWFAFGEAVYDNLLGIWKVGAAWYVVDQSDRANIQFARNWDDLWGGSDYVVGGHYYARLRRPDGSYIIRFIGVDGGGHTRRWVPLTEQYVNGSAYPYEPYVVRTAFDFHPSEWNFLLWEWEWESNSDVVDGVTYYRKAEQVVRAQSVVGSPERVRSARTRTIPKFGPTWFVRVNGAQAMMVARQSHYNTANDGWNALVQFESSSSTDGAPITHLRFIERGSSLLSTTGWLRTRVI